MIHVAVFLLAALAILLLSLGVIVVCGAIIRAVWQIKRNWRGVR